MTTALEVAAPRRSQIFSFAPTSFEQAIKFAEILAGSDIVPKQYKGKPGDILVAMQYGAEVGLQPLQALGSIAVINGRPGLYGDGFLAVILSQPDCIDVIEDDLPAIFAAGKATCIVKRKGRQPISRTFTLAMAEKAGLTTKDGPWKQYTARQLQMRARGFAGRDAYADVLRGIKTVEELMDYSDAPTLEAGQYTATPAVVDEVITQDEARAFGKAWKDAGWTIDQAKAFLKEKLGVESSLKLKKSQYAQAMKWATKAEPATTAIVEPQPANGNGNGQSRDKEICFELFKILGYDDVKQAQAIQEHGADWSKLVVALNKELPTE